MSDLPFTPLVQKLPATVPFTGPETLERELGKPFRARIGANESVFGPSPKAIAAMGEAASDVWRYGDPENFDLKVALAEHHGVEPVNIVVGEGVDALLGYLARMVINEGTPVVTSYGAYPTFNYHVSGFGGRLETVPYKDDHEDVDGLIAKAEACRSPLIYFANPDNPMGTWSDAEAVQRLIDAVPDFSVLCLDEAYIELAPDGTAPKLDVTNPRVIRFRTFSKAYGMAGARVGYGIAEQTLALAFNKVRNHFGVSRIAQAGALAALRDQDYLAKVRGQVREANERIAAIAASNGLSSLPTATNFVAIDCGKDSAFSTRILQELGTRGIFVRKPFVAPQDRYIRVSSGRPEHLDLLEQALPEAIAIAAKD